MAVVRARSAPPYGLFAAVFFAVICAGAAILFYVMWAKQSADLDKAVRDRAAVGTESDITAWRTNPLIDQNDKTHSILKQLSDKVEGMQKDLAAARLKAEQLTAQANTDKADLERANQTAKLASERAQSIETDTQTTLGGNQKSITELNASIAKLQQDLAAAKADYDKAVAEGEKKLTDAQNDAEQRSRENVLQLQAAQATITRQETELKELRQVVLNSHRGGDVAVGEPDGTIIRVDGAAGTAWISLTKNDRIQAGMTFTAYDPRTGVRFATDEQALGNGSLEVIEVRDNASLCRITRTTRDHAVQAGDLISNLVYHKDKTRQFRFVVVGDFDLDGDGVATANERERIIRMVKSWGGVVDNAVSSQTDYLVMGKPPASAATVSTADAAATAPGSIVDERTKDQQAYDVTEQEARRLAIPVLNANRFLAMIGYYNTTVIRY
ncbi:MAG TPA: hypothetical protein VHM90_19570 [Phycisphaerae bacterium]|nr:hypothetical protein [Phycisphaerae bacterium]